MHFQFNITEDVRMAANMMNGMMGGMWIWFIVGVLLVVFLVFAILKIARK
jgi:hypothetical protein